MLSSRAPLLLIAAAVAGTLHAGCGAVGGDDVRDAYCNELAGLESRVDALLERAAERLETTAGFLETAKKLESGQTMSREDAYALASAWADSCAYAGELIGEARGYARAFDETSYELRLRSSTDVPDALDYQLLPGFHCGREDLLKGAAALRAEAKEIRDAIGPYSTARENALERCREDGWRVR